MKKVFFRILMALTLCMIATLGMITFGGKMHSTHASGFQAFTDVYPSSVDSYCDGGWSRDVGTIYSTVTNGDSSCYEAGWDIPNEYTQGQTRAFVIDLRGFASYSLAPANVVYSFYTNSGQMHTYKFSSEHIRAAIAIGISFVYVNAYDINYIQIDAQGGDNNHIMGASDIMVTTVFS